MTGPVAAALGNKLAARASAVNGFNDRYAIFFFVARYYEQFILTSRNLDDEFNVFRSFEEVAAEFIGSTSVNNGDSFGLIKTVALFCREGK